MTILSDPPIIDRDYLYKDKIWTRTGKVLKHENQPVDGEPAPKVQWYHKVGYIFTLFWNKNQKVQKKQDNVINDLEGQRSLNQNDNNNHALVKCTKF